MLEKGLPGLILDLAKGTLLEPPQKQIINHTYPRDNKVSPKPLCKRQPAETQQRLKLIETDIYTDIF